MARKIVTNRLELSKPTQPVTSEEEVQEVVKELIEAFEPLRGKGFGLAANQIGINKAVALLYIVGKQTILVNPRILEKDGRITFQESCFSFSGLTVLTDRYNYIKIESGLKPETMEFTGIAAVAVQHECDHLKGIVLFSRKHKAR